jgi:hypothetical protein
MICNDGVGFDVQQVATAGHFGLTGMQELAQFAGVGSQKHSWWRAHNDDNGVERLIHFYAERFLEFGMTEDLLQVGKFLLVFNVLLSTIGGLVRYPA